MHATLHIERDWHTAVWVCLVILLLLPVALAQELKIEGVEQDAGGSIVVIVPSTTNDYFLLQRNTDLITGNFTNTLMSLGIDGRTRIPMPSTYTRSFFRATRYDATAPDDFDRDGIDDVYEIMNQPLNPLDGSDAAMNFDWDSLSNLQEYLGGTSIHTGDSDGDGFGDDDELADGSLPLDPRSQPVNTSYSPTSAVGYVTSVLNQQRPSPSTNLNVTVVNGYRYSVLNHQRPVASSNLTVQVADGYRFTVLNMTPPVAHSNLNIQVADGYRFSVLNATPPLASTNLTLAVAEATPVSVLNRTLPPATNINRFAEATPYSVHLTIP